MAIEGDYLLDLQRALQRGDRALAARQFAAINAIRAPQRPGDVAIEGDTPAIVSRLRSFMRPN
jgi:hypothetical protein